MNSPISVILLVPFLKHCTRSLVRMKYLSFHRENNLSLCCQSRPFFRVGSASPKTSGEACWRKRDQSSLSQGLFVQCSLQQHVWIRKQLPLWLYLDKWDALLDLCSNLFIGIGEILLKGFKRISSVILWSWQPADLMICFLKKDCPPSMHTASILIKLGQSHKLHLLL